MDDFDPKISNGSKMTLGILLSVRVRDREELELETGHGL